MKINIKYLAILILVIVIIIGVIFFGNRKNENNNSEATEITESEYKERKIQEVVDTFNKEGIELSEEQIARRREINLKGYSYKVKGEEERIEIYILNFDEKREITNDISEEGIIEINIRDEKEIAILRDNILITNVKNSNLQSRIMNVLDKLM